MLSVISYESGEWLVILMSFHAGLNSITEGRWRRSPKWVALQEMDTGWLSRRRYWEEPITEFGYLILCGFNKFTNQNKCFYVSSLWWLGRFGWANSIWKCLWPRASHPPRIHGQVMKTFFWLNQRFPHMLEFGSNRAKILSFDLILHSLFSWRLG